MQTLFPNIKPSHEHRLAVSDTHTLHIEESGREDGIPVLVCHGGPGLACQPLHRRYFDPDEYRIILYDQRGAGTSTPHASLEENTLQDLVDDIEAIRKHLAIEELVLFGGGFGATLSLEYAIQHPDKVKGMVLWSVFLGTAKEIDWMFQHGASRFFPDSYELFTECLSEAEKENVLAAYQKRLHGTDELQRMAAAKSWASWIASVATLHPSHEIYRHYNDPHIASCLAVIGCHYYVHQCFLKGNELLKNIHKIADIPATVIHGRYDMQHPLESAVQLVDSWPSAELNIVRDAGQCESEPGMVDALIRAIKRFARFENEKS